jgi:hypothetical protein
MLLEGKGALIQDLIRETMEKLEKHEMGISRLAKTESLRESLESYKQKIQAKKRNPAALYELALASDRDYRAGDQLSYYVTGNKKKVRVYDNCKLAAAYDAEHPDENVPYYKEKFLALFKKFQAFIPDADNGSLIVKKKK